MDALTREPLDVQTPPPRTRRWVRRVVSLLVGLLLIGGIIYTVWFWPAADTQQAARRNANVTIPVLVAPAVRKDMPIYLDGLGTAQAFQTVTIKTMVDGPLLSVNFTEGQMVHAGDVLAKIDPRTYQAALDNAVAKKAQTEAQLANARLDYARYQKLIANNYASQQQADTAKSLVAQLQATADQDQAAIDNARTQLAYTTIASPIEGRTGIRQVDAGNIVHVGDTTGLVVVTQLQPISVIFTLPQQNLGAVTRAMQAGNPVALAVSQGPAGSAGQVLDRGTLAVLDNQVDQTTGTIKLKATFPNGDLRLWPGAFVTVRLQVRVATDAVVVPAAAIQRGPKGMFAYVADNGTVKRVTVAVGYEDEQGSIITEGLQGGEKVVVEGASRLSDGSKIAATDMQPTADPAAAGQGPPGSRRRRGG